MFIIYFVFKLQINYETYPINRCPYNSKKITNANGLEFKPRELKMKSASTYFTALLIFLFLMSCGTTKSSQHQKEITESYYKQDLRNDIHEHGEPIKAIVKDTLVALEIERPTFSARELGKILRRKRRFLGKQEVTSIIQPVTFQLLNNYKNSNNKEPGGECLEASQARFHKAYEDVHGHSVYQDLPNNTSSKYYSPAQVFNNLFASTYGKHKGWLTLPRKYRARGGAGAIAYAGMGDLIDWYGIWSGELKPGAIMQVWKKRSAYKKVIRGQRRDKIFLNGHSFIFLGYEYNNIGDIIGLRIADQGYRTHRGMAVEDYEVWWAVNLNI